MVARGDICWVELDKRRPCVVVSSSDVLAANVWQTHVVPLTSNIERAGNAGNVLLPTAETGLPKDSVAVPLSLEIVRRTWLSDTGARVSMFNLARIDRGLRQVLGI